MSVIYKYVLAADEWQGGTISMPRGAEILSVQYQREQVCVWAIVDPSKPSWERSFTVVGTGHEFDWANMRMIFDHVGTVQAGPFVWHVFLEKETA